MLNKLLCMYNVDVPDIAALVWLYVDMLASCLYADVNMLATATFVLIQQLVWIHERACDSCSCACMDL